VGAFVAVPAASAQDADAPSESAQADRTLEQVEARFICMINNKVFDSEQIAVPIGETTYYGCCQMCVQKLNEDPESRYVADPVSGNRIDKSEAVLGAAPDGTVYDFESLDNLRAFDPLSVQESRDGK
jgi:YHS domain-containing protein